MQRSKIALQEKNLPHKVELVDVDNKPQDFLSLSRSITADPKGGGTVPIIIGKDSHCLAYLHCQMLSCFKQNQTHTCNSGLQDRNASFAFQKLLY